MTRILATLATLLASGHAMAAQTPPVELTCPDDRIVWVSAHSHVYHVAGDRYFGNTKVGKFLCQHDADAAGGHASKFTKAGVR